MPDRSNMNTPGVYISEVNSFSNSVVRVPTSIPAFVGYTPKANFDGVSYVQRAHKVNSFREFNEIYGVSDDTPNSALPNYYLHEVETEPLDGNYVHIGLAYYHMTADPNTQYYCYQSVKMFFENGGREAYIVAVGTHGKATQSDNHPGESSINSNVILDDLLGGLDVLRDESEPSMYVCPEATLLSVEENATLMQAMLKQCQDLQKAICIFDIIGAKHPDPIHFYDAILTFRENTGTKGLSYGTAYYPFLETTLVRQGDINFNNFYGGDLNALESALLMDLGANAKLVTVMAEIKDAHSSFSLAQKHKALGGVSPLYKEIVALATRMSNRLPPSGAMAGVMANIDSTIGVWKAPANVSIVGVHGLTMDITDTQQADFNVDTISGKSINVIRSFIGHGVLVWGAKTLDGNSSDWRYIPVRRMMIFIEQSSKQALSAYIFESNTKDTWVKAKAMIESFLESLWRDGALQGAKAEEAYAVRCGLGSTMTNQDILDGFMVLEILIAPVRPAEFIILRITQKMAVQP